MRVLTLYTIRRVQKRSVGQIAVKKYTIDRIIRDRSLIPPDHDVIKGHSGRGLTLTQLAPKEREARGSASEDRLSIDRILV